MHKPPTVSQQTTRWPAFLSLPQLPPAASGCAASFLAVIHVSFYWSCQRPLDTGSLEVNIYPHNSTKKKKKKKLLKNMQPPSLAAVAVIAFSQPKGFFGSSERRS